MALLACCNCSLCLLQFRWGSAPPPLSCGVCFTSVTVGSLPLSKHAVGGGTTPAFSCRLLYLHLTRGSAPSLLSCRACLSSASVGSLPQSKGSYDTPTFFGRLVYLQFAWGSAPPPLSHRRAMLLVSICWKPSSLQARWGWLCHTHLLWQACLFIVHVGKCPSPTLQQSMPPGVVPPPPYSEVRVLCPLCYMSFFSVACLLFSFFVCLFLQSGGQSVQGVCWFFSGVVVGEPCAAYLLTCWSTKQVWSHAFCHWSPPGFSIHCDLAELCRGWRCRGVKVLPLLGVFSCPVCLQHLRKIFTLTNRCYLLLPSSCHPWNSLTLIFIDSL
jgi:hypothetical protein